MLHISPIFSIRTRFITKATSFKRVRLIIWNNKMQFDSSDSTRRYWNMGVKRLMKERNRMNDFWWAVRNNTLEGMHHHTESNVLLWMDWKMVTIHHMITTRKRQNDYTEKHINIIIMIILESSLSSSSSHTPARMVHSIYIGTFLLFPLLSKKTKLTRKITANGEKMMIYQVATAIKSGIIIASIDHIRHK